MKNILLFSLNINSYVTAKSLLYSFYHVTYVTSFNKHSGDKLADLSLAFEQDSSKNVRYPSAANIFTYFYLLTKNVSLTLGGGGGRGTVV